MGCETGPDTWAITPTECAKAHNIWVFKVTSDSNGGLNSNQLNGDIHVERKFSPQLAGKVTLLVLTEETATREIVKFNHVLI